MRADAMGFQWLEGFTLIFQGLELFPPKSSKPWKPAFATPLGAAVALLATAGVSFAAETSVRSEIFSIIEV